MMDSSITSIFLLTSAVTANCTGQWWSTGRCWDRWREWSQSWRRTLEANGERVKILDRRLMKEQLRWSSPSPLPTQAFVAVPSSGHGHSCGGRQWVIRQTGQSGFVHKRQVCFVSALSFFSISVALILDVSSSALIRSSTESALAPLIKVVRQFHEAGFMVDLNDDPGTTLNKKIRSAQLAQYNYIFGKDG